MYIQGAQQNFVFEFCVRNINNYESLFFPLNLSNLFEVFIDNLKNTEN